MFDRLIVSEPAGAHIKSRTRYFAFSSMAVAASLAVATVVSIFAADYGLGTDNFEMVDLIAPVVQTPRNEPEPPRQQAPLTKTTSTNPLPSRKVNMQDVNETPREVPTSVSTVQNTLKARPQGDFTVSKLDADPAPAYAGTGRDSAPSTGTGLVALNTTPVERPSTPELPPPPAKPSTPPPPAPPKSMGVVNGMAKSLPKPSYPAAAVALNLQGKVDVQVLIDEHGNVISAKAVSGPSMLKNAAEQAARNARFTPTLLSKVPVKVTGVIVYNFTLG